MTMMAPPPLASPGGLAPTLGARPADPAAPPVTVRPIAPSDAAALERFYAALSDESRTLRFLGWTAGLGAERSRAFCTADHEHREGFVAVTGDEIVGHLCIEPDGAGSAEVAIAVADRLHGRGIGRRLMDAGVAWARDAGLRRFTATAFAWNTRLVRLVRSLGLPVRFGVGTDGTCEIRIELAPGLPAAA
jgi:GNAT superfamily N-acetyltransferase